MLTPTQFLEFKMQITLRLVEQGITDPKQLSQMADDIANEVVNPGK